MLTPRGSGWYSYLASFGVDDDVFSTAARQPRSQRVQDLLHGNGRSYMPSNWFDDNIRLYNSFLSALLAADALQSSATSPSTFPLYVAPSGTTSGCHPVSRSPVPLIRRQIPRYRLQQQELPLRFGIKKSMF